MKRIEPDVRRKVGGVSLIELMIAIAIGSILLLGLVQVFSASRAAYATAEGMARVQENGRFAVDYLLRDIRMAGHFGCVNDQAHWVKGTGDLVNHLGTADPALNFDVSIIGYEAANTEPGQTATLGALTPGWSPTVPAGILALSPHAGSDIISIRYLAGEGIPAETLTAVSDQTEVEFPSARELALTSDGVSTPTLFGVADCSGAEVFRGAIIGDTVLSSDIPAGGEFSGKFTGAANGGNTQLFRADSIVYYVGTGASGESSLFRARATGTGAYVAEELVEGIESLQFLYGRDATAVISQETPPLGDITMQDTAAILTADPVEWRRVGLVQIGMLVKSPTPAVAPDPATADARPRVLGVRFDPPAVPDSHYRQSYEVTLALRNRLFGN